MISAEGTLQTGAIDLVARLHSPSNALGPPHTSEPRIRRAAPNAPVDWWGKGFVPLAVCFGTIGITDEAPASLRGKWGNSRFRSECEVGNDGDGCRACEAEGKADPCAQF